MSTVADITGKLSSMLAGGVFGLALSQLLQANFSATLVFALIGTVFIVIAKNMFDQYDRFAKHVGKP